MLPKRSHESKLYKKRGITFDKREFLEFLSENNITYMIRGSSPADKGFKLQFSNRCISIFSVCNYKNRHNEGSVVLVDRESQSLRIIRFQNPTETPPPTRSGSNVSTISSHHSSGTHLKSHSKSNKKSHSKSSGKKHHHPNSDSSPRKTGKKTK